MTHPISVDDCGLDAGQAKATTIESAIKDLEDAEPTVAEGNGRLQPSEDLAQAVIAFDQRGHIRLAFDNNDEAYDISALQQQNQDITRPDTPSCPEVQSNVPAMAICIMIVGTRGDVQPFVGIAKRLQQDGHRVRLATHAVYRDFVTEHGVEFYPLGGDPKELAAYMVKTGGHLIPLDYETITKDVPRNMQMIDEILNSTWPAVSAPDPDALGKGVPGQPFRAQAIISNPVTYGHIHVAERLGVPLHIMFPQPWVPTVAFPHPLSNMPYDDKPQKRNYMSYKLVDLLMWQGTESIVNQFRTQVLGLRKIRKGDGGRDLLLDLAIPHAFMWSPALVPKPADWGTIYDVIGTVLLKEAGSKYTPTPELEAFLGNDGGPIFVGFGSMVIADPKATTTMIIEAARLANVRVLIQSSWSDMAAGIDVPDNIFFLGNCPHDWLMPRVSAVVHHGGAGTTAAGLLAGKPTFIVPFFGDQPFWGRAVVRAGVGVEPCPIAKLSVEKLHQAFVGLQTSEIRSRAVALRDVMNAEDGVGEAVKCFYRHLPLKVMVCEMCEKNTATKWSEKDKVRMCTLCETVTTARKGNSSNNIRPYQSVDLLSHGPNSTLAGLTSGTGAFLHELGSGVKDIFIKPAQGFRKGGATGAVVGLTKGLVSCVLIRPIHGVVIFADHIATGHHNAHRGPTGRKVGSLWMDNKRLRKWAGYKTAPVAHTATMTPDDHLRQKKLPEMGTVAVYLSTEERQTMTMKLQALLAATKTPAQPVTAASTARFTTVESRTIPKMTITILATGTWSENIQPFVAIGLRLQADGHFVRIATNECYRTRIVGKGLNFFPLGGEATTIASYLVYCNELSKQKRRLFSFARRDFPALNELRDFVFSLWPACVGQESAYRGLNYRADLIISHPLVFGQSIVAERLGVPLHCISDTPQSHTKAFPHLQHSLDTCSFPYNYLQANAVTHSVADKLLWKGMRHILDSFRTYVGLPSTTNRHNILRKWRIPHSYLWNAALLPKPTDWGQEISIVGFIDVDDANEDGRDTNHASASLLNQVKDYVAGASTPVIYFGLVRGDWEPLRVKRLLHEIEEAAKSANVRVIFQTDVASEVETPYHSPAVFEVASTMPTKLLVPFVGGAVHWGGVSVVASWLKTGIPSCVVARDAMQRMWGQAIAHAGVGADPLDVEALSSARLASAFGRLLDASVVENARQMSQSFSSEVAIEKVVEHLYSSLPVEAMQCDLDPTRVARTYDPVRELKLSYEGRLIVQSVFQEDENEPKVPSMIKYKPLKYSLRHVPKVSLQQLRTRRRSKKAAQIIYDGDKRGKPSRVRVTINNFSLSRHGVRPLEKSLVLDVVDAPPNWPTFDAWPAHVSRIDASYEKIIRERLRK